MQFVNYEQKHFFIIFFLQSARKPLSFIFVLMIVTTNIIIIPEKNWKIVIKMWMFMFINF